jgi:hypothetical protein
MGDQSPDRFQKPARICNLGGYEKDDFNRIIFLYMRKIKLRDRDGLESNL